MAEGESDSREVGGGRGDPPAGVRGVDRTATEVVGDPTDGVAAGRGSRWGAPDDDPFPAVRRIDH